MRSFRCLLLDNKRQCIGKDFVDMDIFIANLHSIMWPKLAGVGCDEILAGTTLGTTGVF